MILLAIRVTKMLDHNKVSVRFYSAGQYKTLQGIVEQIDPTRGVLKVSGITIVFEYIAKIERIETGSA